MMSSDLVNKPNRNIAVQAAASVKKRETSEVATEPAQTGAAADTPPDNAHKSVPDRDELSAHLKVALRESMAEFYEFQQMGHNKLYPKPVDIKALQAQIGSLQIPALMHPLQEPLKKAANNFLERFWLFRDQNNYHHSDMTLVKFRLAVGAAGWDSQQTRDYNEALKHANRLSNYLSGTLELIRLFDANANLQTPWQDSRSKIHDALLNELLPVDVDNHHNQYTAQVRGNLTNGHPDNLKFNAIVNSVILDEKIAREALIAEIKRLSGSLLGGIELIIHYAQQTDGKSENSVFTRDMLALC